MFDARQIANWFILKAQAENKTLSIMQLLKLVYIAHGWHLEMRKLPLITNKIEAWRRGPVIRDVYNDFRPQGIYVDKPLSAFPIEVDGPYDTFLSQIFDIYGKKSAFELSDMTHVKDGPWDVVTANNGLFAAIPDDIIMKHYEDLRTARKN